MDFDSILTGYSESVSRIAHILREKILSLDSRIVEQISGGSQVKSAFYSIGNANNMIAVISPADDHCKIYLHYFDQVDTSSLHLEGAGKHSRHIKLHNPDELPRAELKECYMKLSLVQDQHKELEAQLKSRL